MPDLFESSAPEEPSQPDTQYLFVDEAGDPTLFHSSGKVIVNTLGCSGFFILGKLEVEAPLDLAAKLTVLRQELIADDYFYGVESFKPERKKTALLFHAKDDLPEVRYRVFDLLRSAGDSIRFHAVVCDKEALAKREMARREREPGYRYDPDSIYDGLIRSLFSKMHRLADNYEVCIAKRGKKDRNAAIQEAMEHAERDFQSKFGFSRGGKDVQKIEISNPQSTVCLQAVDYFLWAVQRFYEARINERTKEVIREDRFLKMLGSQVVEIHDLDFGPSQGTFWTPQNPLTIEARFAEKERKKKKS